MKIRKFEEENKIIIEVYNKKQVFDRIIRYDNECIVCHKHSVDLDNFGEQHICDECMKVIRKKLGVEKKAEKELKPIPQQKSVKEYSTAQYMIKNAVAYKTNVEINNVVEYQNLMTMIIRAEVINMLFDMILHGINTVEKIAKAVGKPNAQTSVYSYVRQMAKVGLVFSSDGRQKNMFNRIWHINPKVDYTVKEVEHE